VEHDEIMDNLLRKKIDQVINNGKEKFICEQRNLSKEMGSRNQDST
jgi:hypothetical protein